MREGGLKPMSIPRMSHEARGVLHQQVRAQGPVSPVYWEGIVRWRSLPSDIRGGLLDPLVPRAGDRLTPSLTVGPAGCWIATRPVDGEEGRGGIRREGGPPSPLAAALADDAKPPGDDEANSATQTDAGAVSAPAGDSRVYLGASYGEKEACEAWGGEWDPTYRSCFVPARLNPSPFVERWGERRDLTDRWRRWQIQTAQAEAQYAQADLSLIHI